MTHANNATARSDAQAQRTAEIIALDFKAVQAIPPGPAPYDANRYALLMRVAEDAKRNTQAQIVEMTEWLKERQPPPGTLSAAAAPHRQPDDEPDLPFHPAADIFPLMSDAQLKTLAEDIIKNGQQEAIKTLDGMIIIGRNRYRACRLAGIEPRIEAYPVGINTDPRSLVISSNRHRTHLTPAQIAWIGFQYTQLNYGEALTQTEAALLTSINIDQIRSAAVIDRVALPEIKAAIQNGEIGKIGHAYKIVTLSKDEKLDGLTSEQKQTLWLNNRTLSGGAKTLSKPVFPITAKQIKALTGEQRFVIADKLLEGLAPKQLLTLFEKRFDIIERALEPGMRIFIGEKP